MTLVAVSTQVKMLRCFRLFLVTTTQKKDPTVPTRDMRLPAQIKYTTSTQETETYYTGLLKPNTRTHMRLRKASACQNLKTLRRWHRGNVLTRTSQRHQGVAKRRCGIPGMGGHGRTRTPTGRTTDRWGPLAALGCRRCPSAAFQFPHMHVTHIRVRHVLHLWSEHHL